MHSVIFAEHRTQQRAAILRVGRTDNNCQRVVNLGAGFARNPKASIGRQPAGMRFLHDLESQSTGKLTHPARHRILNSRRPVFSAGTDSDEPILMIGFSTVAGSSSPCETHRWNLLHPAFFLSARETC